MHYIDREFAKVSIVKKELEKMVGYVRRIYWIVRDPSNFDFEGIAVPLKCSRELYHVRRAIYSGSYEKAERDALRILLRADDIVLEAGAGCGIVTAFIAKRLSTSSNIHTFEANPNLIKTINAVARANDIAPHVHNAALGLENGEVEFYVAPNFVSSSHLNRDLDSKKIIIPCVGISELFQTLQPTVLVFDIEGGETIFSDMQLPATVRVISCELHPHIIGDEAVSKVIANFIAQGFALKLDCCSGRAVSFERVGH